MKQNYIDIIKLYYLKYTNEQVDLVQMIYNFFMPLLILPLFWLGFSEVV